MISHLYTVMHQPFDYQYLNGLLKDYRYPRNKIGKMLKSGDLIALKSGLYILSEQYQKPLSLETAANLLYGPSYVSLEYALAYYGLIPEIAYQVTSVTNARKKVYYTAVGTFTYHQLKQEYYSLGYRVQKTDTSAYLIASPEKALCDKLYLTKPQANAAALEVFLSENLRLDTSALHSLDAKLISALARVAKHVNLNQLKKMVTKDGL